MASQGLFGHTGRSSSKNLVEFRAGKMTMKGTTVTPDKRKGLVYIYQSEDSLMHFCWKDRGNGTVEDVSKVENHCLKLILFFSLLWIDLVHLEIAYLCTLTIFKANSLDTDQNESGFSKINFMSNN